MSFDAGVVRALVFAVFGTVVDWRSSIVQEGKALAQRRGLAVDWPAFADDWRAGYTMAMDQVRRGELPWTHIDGLHRRILDGRATVKQCKAGRMPSAVFAPRAL